MPPKFSGIQKEVFGLYRTILREASKKDRLASNDTQSILSLWSQPDSTASYARKEFRHQAHKVPRNDFRTIEHKIRNGYKQVKVLKMPGVKVVSGAWTHYFLFESSQYMYCLLVWRCCREHRSGWPMTTWKIPHMCVRGRGRKLVIRQSSILRKFPCNAFQWQQVS